jgi:hypothetical protein
VPSSAARDERGKERGRRRESKRRLHRLQYRSVSRRCSSVLQLVGQPRYNQRIPVYELVLRYEDRDETRFTERPPPLGSPFQLDGHRWIAWVAEQPELARDLRAAVRYVCVEVCQESERLREQSGWLRALGAGLRARSVVLRDKAHLVDGRPG